MGARHGESEEKRMNPKHVVSFMELSEKEDAKDC